MKVLGLIVEYNPLHNGHIHHITQSKKIVDPDLTIAVMSGHFTQRGEPTCTTKWLRTDLAIANGIDLVVELPYAYSNQAADLFAVGAISILKHLRATHLVFGSELGDISELTRLANEMDHPELLEQVKDHLATGMNLPAAYVQANPKFKGPNNTLGIQYIRAISQLDAKMIPLTLKRHAAQYNDPLPAADHIASATAIRKMIDDGIDYAAYIPMPIDDPNIHLQQWAHHYKFLRHKLLTTSTSELKKIHDVIEGVENRFIAAAMTSSNFDDFIKNVGTKRYTNTRIQRICANILIGLTKTDIKNWELPTGAPYVRILGFNKKGATYLKQLKKNIEVPIYSTFEKNAHPMLKHEQKVTAAYASVYDASYATEVIKKEYAQKPIMKN